MHWLVYYTLEAAVTERTPMSRIVLGIICGLVFGAIDIGIMLPMSFPDKKAAIPAAFIARFGIGFVIGAARLPWPGWAVGLCFGLLLSIPDALITKAYAPIISMGAVGGTIIAFSSGDSGIRFKRLTLIDKSLAVHFWFYKLKLHYYRPKDRDNLGDSCGDGGLADPHSGRLGFPFRRHTKVFLPGLPRRRTLCENRHSLTSGHGAIWQSG
jgi:hypothetical protein